MLTITFSYNQQLPTQTLVNNLTKQERIKNIPTNGQLMKILTRLLKQIYYKSHFQVLLLVARQ